jgi:hypothetical protein
MKILLGAQCGVCARQLPSPARATVWTRANQNGVLSSLGSEGLLGWSATGGATFYELSTKHGRSGVSGLRAQFLLDTQKLVVLGYALTAARGTALQLSGPCRDGEIGDEVVRRLAGAMADHNSVMCLARDRDGF